MAISGFFTVNSSVSETLNSPENRSGSIVDSIRQSYQFSMGGGAGQNNLVWSDRRTVAAGATDTIRLNLGGLTDAFGNPVNFATVTGITIYNREILGGTRIINFGPAAAATFLWVFNLAGARTHVQPGSAYTQWDDVGVASPPGAADIAIINTDGANTVTYDILVVGRS